MSNENLKNKSVDELREMKAKGEAELKVLHNKSKYYESQINLLTRKERTHRLCTRGAMLEKFLGCPNELTDEQIVTFLQQRNITTADSLWKMIEEVSVVQSRIDTADERIKELKKGIKFLGDYAKYKTVADEYSKKKFGRDKFKSEHSKELNSFYRAKRWIDENPKSTTKSLKAEIEKLQTEKATDEALIECNYGSLEELKRAKTIISKVLANVRYHEQEEPRQTAQKIKKNLLSRIISVAETVAETVAFFFD